MKSGSQVESKGGAHCEKENAQCVADGNEVMWFHCLGLGVRVYNHAAAYGDTNLPVHYESNFEVDGADAGLSGWSEEAHDGE